MDFFNNPDNMGCIVAILAFIFIGGGILFGYVFPIPLWFAASISGVRIGLGDMFNLRMKNVPPDIIINALIMAQKANIKEYISCDDLASYYLMGGRVMPVVRALISADKANIDLSFSDACAIDRAGRDVLEAVRMSVNPRVLETPPIAAMAQDGIEIIAKCRVTVRANIKSLVGGAGEETILARVQEGICTAIGSSEHYQDVLESPELISKAFLQREENESSAFEILSIDIADLDIGRNIGSELQINQAQADKEIAQAKAETRKSEALAREQEMKAYVQQMKAKVVEAQAQIPIAMSEALKTGRISVMNYYNLKNLLADTQMRESMSGVHSEGLNI